MAGKHGQGSLLGYVDYSISPLTCTAAQQLGVHSEHETVPVYQQHFYIIELTPNPTYSWN